MKNILTILLISALIFSAIPATAADYTKDVYGEGTFTMSQLSADDIDLQMYQQNAGTWHWQSSAKCYFYQRNITGHTGETTIRISTARCAPSGSCYAREYSYGSYTNIIDGACKPFRENIYCAPGSNILQGWYIHANSGVSSWSNMETCGNQYLKLTVTFFTGTPYHLTGNISCVDYINKSALSDTGEYELIEQLNTIGASDYDMDIINGEDYRITYSNGYTFDFSCSDNVIQDVDACVYMYINLKDYCGNNMTNTSCDIYKSDGGVATTYEFVGTYFRQNPVKLLIGTDVAEGKMLDIYMDTDMGDYHIIDYCENKTLDILHPSKYWTMAYGAFDIDTRVAIEGVKVTANQTCVINPDHPLKQYLFTGANGYGTFIGLSGDRIDVTMQHPDYYSNEDSNFFINIPCDAFQTTYSIDTYLNKSTSEFVDENQTENLTEGCSVWFVDQTGKRDSHINDTDTYVDMYYKNANCTATLKFQRLYSTYWMTKRSFNIPALESGYKRIYNVNFSDADANYRGYLYASECECNNTKSLYVSNSTIEEDQHYQNLTAHCKFKHQIGGGQVDYRSDVEILAYAYSNTSHTLLNINLTLYNKTVLIASKQCDWSDFAGASPKWFYVWSPNVEYGIGNNYTVIMTGYNGLNLDADDVWTSNIRNNKLTVHVKDNHDTPVTHSTLFVQGWGSHAMDSASTFTLTGLQDEVYQYKATKSGYTSSGWASINFTGTDQTVTCVLIAQETDSITGYKLKDCEIKAFFIPLMYMLLIMILIGGVMNAAKR